MGLETILEIALWGVVGLARAMSFVAWLLIVLGLGIRDHIGLTRRGSICKGCVLPGHRGNAVPIRLISDRVGA